jgi:hypothetical protein
MPSDATVLLWKKKTMILERLGLIAESTPTDTSAQPVPSLIS